MAGTAFPKDRLLEQLAAAEAAVKEPLDRDARAVAARKEGAGGPGMFGKPPALKAFVEKRTASVAAQVAGTSKGFVPAGGFGGPPNFGAVLAPPMMEGMDKDGDDRLSRGEWVGAAQRLFAGCAKDEAGTVDLKALTAGLGRALPPPPEGAPPGGFNLAAFLAGPIMDRADADKDKRLTSEEVLAAAKTAFDAFDKAKAGRLDEDGFAAVLTALFPAPKFGPPGGPPKP